MAVDIAKIRPFAGFEAAVDELDVPLREEDWRGLIDTAARFQGRRSGSLDGM